MLVAATTLREVADLLAQLVGLVILAGAIAALAALLYRWYVREQIPAGLSLLLGLAAVTVHLNTSYALGQVIGGSTLPTETEVALFNITAFALATCGAVAGRYAGDRISTDVLLREGIDSVEKDVGRLVQSVGRVIAVELPGDIDDTVGYDPVPVETKETLAGKTFLFPKRLTVTELRERLIARLKTDYAVGHVDMELADDGTVEYLALGSRAAGIGPTLPPATNAVAIRADPAFAASAGDLVQVWETDPMRRVLTAELRGVADDTVTVAIDAADTPKIDPRTEYRLVTLPVDDRPDREFASLLRAAEETFSSVTVQAGSPLHGLPAGALVPTVVAIKPEEGQPTALPAATYVLEPGDTVFAIARPEALRRLERAGEPLDPSLVSSAGIGRPTSGETGVEPAESTVETTTTESTQPGEPTPAPGESDTAPAERDDIDTTPHQDDVAATVDQDGDTTTAAPEEGIHTDEDADADGDVGTASSDAGDGDEATNGADDDSGVSGRADASSFEELKSEFESGEAEWSDDQTGAGGDDTDGSDGRESGEESGEALFSESGVEGLDIGDDSNTGRPDSRESTDGEDGQSTEPVADDADSDEPADGDDADGLFEEELAFDDGAGDDDTDDTDDEELDLAVLDDAGGGDTGEDDLTTLGDSEEDDGLASLDVDEDDGGLDLDDDIGFDEKLDKADGEDGTDEDGDDEESKGEGDDEETDGEENDGGDEDSGNDGDSDDSGSGGGGGKSFQELKEEFESGDADWEDDVSDSPGGDMRLDE